jgi:ubiquinone/menaquinone biosynthesis C-methylase UbiE
MAKGGTKTAPRSEEYPVCPWRHVKYIDNFMRPLVHDPRKLFGRYVGPNMTALDIGCGGGFASLGLARLVGDGGRVIAADVQPEMLQVVEARAREAGLSERIQTHQCPQSRIGVTGPVDFALAFFMVHEVPDQEGFLTEISAILAPDGCLFVAEPLFHTTKRDFGLLIDRANKAGLAVVERPKVFFGRAVVLKKRMAGKTGRDV